MKELSLFTGIGGGLLGTELLLGFQTIGAVEIDRYCCKVLEQRQRDGCLSRFPIWNMDIREFNERIAGSYAGVVDIVTAGFPCQPFSVAGKRRGDQDERNMWPATIECIRLVRPQFILLENVPGLLVHEYVRRIYGDLAESGYRVKWRCLSAAEVGANHRRNRWWIVANTAVSRLEGQESEGQSRKRNGLSAECGWWATEPDVDRLADGISSRLERIKAIGNAQVPAVVAAVWRLLGGA